MARKARVVRARLPAGRRVLAISDIHGNLPFLKGVLSAAGYGAGDVLVLVGDLVEKGPDSLSTLRYIMDLAARNDVYCLRGNCDNLVTAFVAELGEEARVNTPSTLGGNWAWRLPQNYRELYFLRQKKPLSRQ